MTKYILHGGETGVENDHNRDFYREWVRDFDDSFVPTTLLVYFAREKAEWSELERSDRERFAKYTHDRNVRFVVADSDPSVLRQQIHDADVVYVRGGGSGTLMEMFGTIKDELRAILDGKTYAGSSAGVMYLAHYCRSHRHDWHEGLGILPINAAVHWFSEHEESLKEFKRAHPDNTYEYLLLPETEFVVRMFESGLG